MSATAISQWNSQEVLLKWNPKVSRCVWLLFWLKNCHLLGHYLSYLALDKGVSTKNVMTVLWSIGEVSPVGPSSLLCLCKVYTALFHWLAPLRILHCWLQLHSILSFLIRVEMLSPFRPSSRNHFLHLNHQSYTQTRWEMLALDQALGHSQDENLYSYMPLSPSNTEIRLLSIKPGTFSDDIECTLQHADLSSKPVYEALSYCWANRKICIILHLTDLTLP